MADAIAGVAFISINGQRYRLVGEAKYRLSGETREAKNGSDGFHGYKAKPQNGQIEFKVRDSRGVPLSVFNDMTDETVVLELANGKTVTGRNMFRSGEPVESDAEEAEVMLMFEGPDVRDAA